MFNFDGDVHIITNFAEVQPMRQSNNSLCLCSLFMQMLVSVLRVHVYGTCKCPSYMSMICPLSMNEAKNLSVCFIKTCEMKVKHILFCFEGKFC
jgi:hypothetical protein